MGRPEEAQIPGFWAPKPEISWIWGRRPRNAFTLGAIPVVFRPPSDPPLNTHEPSSIMKVLSSLSSAKRRHADCQVVKRKGTVYVICKSNPKFKARQGATPGTRLSKKGL